MVEKLFKDNTHGTLKDSVETFGVKILGIGGASDITSKQTAGANLALGAYMKFQKARNNNWLSRHAIYVLYNTRAGNTSDTNVVARTFLFPDIGKRDFTIGYEWLIYRDENDPFKFIPFAEFSWSKNILSKGEDSSSRFHSFNFSFGTKVTLTKEFQLGDDAHKQFGFTIYPYYQLIAVDPKDFDLRNQILGENNLPPTFHTVGIYASVQVAELGIFANYKRVMNDTDNITNRDLRGGILVIGALISRDIFSF